MSSFRFFVGALALIASGFSTAAQPCFPERPIGQTDVPTFIESVSPTSLSEAPVIFASVRQAAGGFGANGIYAWRYPEYEPLEILDPLNGVFLDDWFDSIQAGDIDNDGEEEIIARATTDALYCVENGEKRLIGSALAFQLADLNHDGKPDILAIDNDIDGDDRYLIKWHDGAEWVSIAFRPSDVGMGPIYAADYNGDGALDVVHGGSVFVSTGDPYALFAERLIASDAKLLPVDLDSDSDIDLVAAGEGLVWLENNGESVPSFTSRLITDELTGDVAIGDLNGDGHPDVASDAENWYVNNGAGRPQFIHVALSLNAQGGSLIEMGELTNDSLTDFVARSSDGRSLRILENTFVENIRTNERYYSLSEAIEQAAAGDRIVASALAFSAQCDSRLDLQGNALQIESTSYIERGPDTVTILPDGSTLAAIDGSLTFSGTLSLPPLTAATLSSDVGLRLSGPLDLQSGSVLVIHGSLELTPGSGINLVPHTIATPAPPGFTLADLEGDGDLDVIQNPTWWENLNDGTSFAQRSITLPSGSGSFADLDGDGDADLIRSSGWYRNNPGSANPFSEFYEFPIESKFCCLLGATGDFNNDGDIDILVLGINEDQGREAEYILENNGEDLPYFSLRQIGLGEGHSSVHTSLTKGDYSGDGYLDYAVAYSGTDGMFGYSVLLRTNNGSVSPSFGTTQLAGDINEERIGDVASADINGNGRDEVLYIVNGYMSTYGDVSLSWPIATSGPVGVRGADLDQDLADEILVQNQAGDLAAYRIAGQEIERLNRIDLLQGVERFAVADLDNDGDSDIVYSDAAGLSWLENRGGPGHQLHAPDSGILAMGPVLLRSVELSLGDSAYLESTFGVTVNTASTVSGRGSLIAPLVSVSGALAPNPGQTLWIVGDYQQFTMNSGQTQNGRMLIDLGDGETATSVRVSGVANLAGSLIVSADDGFDPPVGSEFVVLTAGEPIGTNRFDVAFLPGLPGGKFLRPVYDVSGAAPAGSGKNGGSVVLVVDSLNDDELGGPTSFSVSGVASDVSLGDLNDDGFDDLAVVIPDDVDPENTPGTLALLINGQTNQPSGQWPGFTGGTVILPTGPMPTAVAIGDLDQVFGNDLAIAVASTGMSEFYISNGSNDVAARFEPRAPAVFNASPQAIVLTDLNLDTFPDVILAGHPVGGLPSGPGEVMVRLNLGRTGMSWDGLESTSHAFMVGSRPVDMASRDLDEEKDLDLVSANAAGNSLSILENLGLGGGGVWLGFAPAIDVAVGAGPVRVIARDLDEEKDLDLISFDRAGNSISIVLQTVPGAPTLGDAFGSSTQVPVGTSPLSGALWDPDGDGDPDPAVVVTNQNGDRVVRLLRNLSSENSMAGSPGLSFVFDQDIQAGSGPYLVVTGRINNNTGDDLAVLSDPSSEVNERGQGGSGQTYLDLGTGCAADINGDGFLNFFDVSAFVQAYTAKAPQADLNNDGSHNFFDVSLFLQFYTQGCP